MTHRLNYSALSKEQIKPLVTLGEINRKKLGNTVLDLINLRVSQINGCTFCVDMHSKEAKIHGERELRLYHLPVWRESPLFDAKERALLGWVEAATRLGKHGVSDEIYAEALAHFTETELSDITFAIATINAWNRLGVSFRSTPGSLDALYGLDKAGL
jgi:AhpD family alkylhydroperoxidase